MLKKLKSVARRILVDPGGAIDTGSRTVLLFIGSPRTGSTLLGQILNYHPQCLISFEENVVGRHLVKFVSFEKLLVCMAKSARETFEKGLEKTGRMNAGVYQPRWSSFADLRTSPDFKKRDIAVVGDKKAGGTAMAVRDHPETFIRLIKNNPSFKLLQVIRNPITAALSYMKSHAIDSFEEACSHIVETTGVAYGMTRLFPQQSFTVFYEDLLEHPEKTLTGLCGFLTIQVSSSWLEEIIKRINRGKPLDRERYESLLESTREIIITHEALEAFSRYCDVVQAEDGV